MQTFIHFQQLTTHRFNAIMNKNIKAMTKIGKESVGIQRAGQGESRLQRSFEDFFFVIRVKVRLLFDGDSTIIKAQSRKFA